MAETPSIPPKVSWMQANDEETELQVVAQWDAGIVQAGEDSVPQVFYVWNNYKGSSDVADMINTKISVRDKDGDTVDKDICEQKRAVVLERMFNRKLGGGQWGSYGKDEEWHADATQSLIWNAPVFVVAADGETKGTISGKANAGRFKDDESGDSVVLADYSNFAKLELTLHAQTTAEAGLVTWRTRISYQYI